VGAFCSLVGTTLFVDSHGVHDPTDLMLVLAGYGYFLFNFYLIQNKDIDL